MIEIRFKQRYSNEISTSPIKLRFNIDYVEPESKEVAVDCQINWYSHAIKERQQTIEWTSVNIGASIIFDYNSGLGYEVNLNNAWSEKTTEQKEFNVLWRTGLNVSNIFELTFKPNTPIEENQNSISWLNNLDTESTTLLMPWRTGLINESSWQFDWRVTPDLNQKVFVIYYGQTDKEYICYWRSHPFKGYAKLDFNAPYQARTGSIKMRFNAPDKVCYWGLPGGLVRSDDDIPTIDRKIPVEPQIRKTYFMNNNIECIRVSDGKRILISSFSYQLSRSQFAATCSISFCSRIDFERSQDELLKIDINGYDFYMHVESPSTRLKFNSNSFSATGRSRMAELSEPFVESKSYTNSTAKTLAGLMTEVVSNTGWSIDNKMIDFSVPAFAFTYQNKTPAEALSLCSNAIGGMLDFDDESKVIKLTPKWPVMPWDTENAICDVIINDSVILDHSKSKVIKPTSNVVFVRGEQQGVSCKVKRSGTLLDKPAADVVDQLITHVQAARQRGSKELAETGNKWQSSIRTKIMQDLPPIKPGMLLGIRYGDDVYKATCESVSISASVSATGLTSVNQTFTVLKNE